MKMTAEEIDKIMVENNIWKSPLLAYEERIRLIEQMMLDPRCPYPVHVWAPEPTRKM